MKKTLIILSICSIIIACNSSNTTTSTSDTSVSADSQVTAAPVTADTTTAAPAPTDAPAADPQNQPAAQAPAASKSEPAKPAQAPAAAKPASTAKGEQLISKSDCLTCHKVNEKLVGPSYTAVALKYDDTEANINHLADKIISGGSGAWGEIPMVPHPTLSKDDAKEMAKYILSLK